MANDREIKRHIKSVKNIGQVTRAMEAVSASKMRRAQQQLRAARPYAEKAREVLNFLAFLPREGQPLHPLLATRPVSRIAVILITADRGLAGGFNSHVIRKVARFIRGQEKPVEVVTIGRKGRDFSLRFGLHIRATFAGVGDKVTAVDAGPVARLLMEDFVTGHFDAVYLCYTDFINTAKQTPVLQPLLPIKVVKPEVKWSPDYIFEPDPQTILDDVLYRFLEWQVLAAMYESIASEHSARMVAMPTATDAASDLQAALTLSFNKARQERITREILDIAGGANALA